MDSCARRASADEIAPVQSGRTHSVAPPPAVTDCRARQPLPPLRESPPSPRAIPLTASPVAVQMAHEHGLDLAQIKPAGGRVDKADVLAYLARSGPTSPVPAAKGMGNQLPVSPSAQDKRAGGSSRPGQNVRGEGRYPRRPRRAAWRQSRA